jgi:hypothetical protein
VILEQRHELVRDEVANGRPDEAFFVRELAVESEKIDTVELGHRGPPGRG